MSKGSKSFGPLLFQLFKFQPKKGDRTKIKIIEGAIECIASRGIANTTINAIAKKTRISKSHVLYHFPDKGEIIIGAIKYVTFVAQRITIEKVQKAKHWRTQLEAIFDGALEWAKKHPTHVPVMLQFYQLCTVDSKFKKMHNEIRNVGRTRIYSVLKEAAYNNELKSEGLESMAQNIHNLLTGYLIEHFTSFSFRSQKELRTALLNGLNRLLESNQQIKTKL